MAKGIAGVRSTMIRFLKEHGYNDEIKNENHSKAGYGKSGESCIAGVIAIEVSYSNTGSYGKC